MVFLSAKASPKGSPDSGHGSINEAEVEENAIYTKPNKSLRSTPDSRFVRVFHEHRKIGNIDIIVNFVFPYISSYLLYLYHMMLVNVKLDVSGHKRIMFQVCRFHWPCLFLIVQVKQNWQYWQGSLVSWSVCEKLCCFD